MTEPLLKVTNLHRYFSAAAGKLHILQGVEFEVQEGEFLAIVGESGSGKSTMLQLLGTLEQPDEGEVRIDGELIHGLGSNREAKLRNEKIGFVYQAHHLIPELTALENVTLPLLVQGMDAAQAAQRGLDLLTRLKMADRAQHVPGKLSGGEAQRVAVARSLSTRPRLLLADEPTGNLDERTAQEVFELLRLLCQEERAAVVMVTHSKSLAKACDRVLRLHDGRLVRLDS
ncbi:MAG: ABC transporter ATP-binding protein [Mariprofundus sp.]|nr:ABC transporter ATP-binding protein [Mariprofundus sp.]